MSEDDKGIYGTLEVHGADIVQNEAIELDKELVQTIENLNNLNIDLLDREVQDANLVDDALQNIEQDMSAITEYLMTEITAKKMQELYELLRTQYHILKTKLVPDPSKIQIPDPTIRTILSNIERAATTPIRDLLTEEQRTGVMGIRKATLSFHTYARLYEAEPRSAEDIEALIPPSFHPTEEEAAAAEKVGEVVAEYDRELYRTIFPSKEKILEIVDQEKEYLLKLFKIEEGTIEYEKIKDVPLEFLTKAEAVPTPYGYLSLTEFGHFDPEAEVLRINRAYSGRKMQETIRHELVHAVDVITSKRNISRLKRNIQDMGKISEYLERMKATYDVPSYVSKFVKNAIILLKRNLRGQHTEGSGHGKRWENLMITAFGMVMDLGTPFDVAEKSLVLELEGEEVREIRTMLQTKVEEGILSTDEEIRQYSEEYYRAGYPVTIEEAVKYIYEVDPEKLPIDYDKFFPRTEEGELRQAEPAPTGLPDPLIPMPFGPRDEVDEPELTPQPTPEPQPAPVPEPPRPRTGRRRTGVRQPGTRGRPRSDTVRFGSARGDVASDLPQRVRSLRDPLKIRQLNFIDLANIGDFTEDILYGRYCG